MTKLQQWVFVLTVFSIIYFLALKDALPFTLCQRTKLYIQLSPIFIVGLFGVYSVVVILYRVATFNDCNEAADELKKQIEEARSDLKSKGYKFE